MTRRDDFMRAAERVQSAVNIPGGGLVAMPNEDAAEIAIMLRKAAEMAEAIEQTECPRPCNGRPDDFTVALCIAAKECGCVYGAALSGEEE